MTITVTTGIDAGRQESSFMNATLQSATETHSVSIAVHLPDGALRHAGVDPDDANQVETWMANMFASAIAQGCRIEVQIGPDETDGDQTADGEAEVEAHAS